MRSPDEKPTESTREARRAPRPAAPGRARRLVRACVTLPLLACLLLAPVAALASKGEKNYRRGLEHEAAERWEKAAEEFALAAAAEPANAEYQLHYRRAVFNASQ
ncbi:MAG TPA: hypothetical protein VN228_19085, partial [Pyrinomonadaceae bacterium]|nr:hypothetical protein [Pyrinomonadaceae bacterium]